MALRQEHRWSFEPSKLRNNIVLAGGPACPKKAQLLRLVSRVIFVNGFTWSWHPALQVKKFCECWSARLWGF